MAMSLQDFEPCSRQTVPTVPAGLIDKPLATTRVFRVN
jgi:hypothetical protein